MKSLYIVSTETGCGKTALITGLLAHLREDKFDVGYMKPVSGEPRVVGAELVDMDTRFMQDTFALPDALDQLAPVLLTDSVIEQALGAEGDLPSQIRAAYQALALNGRGLLLEGAGDLAEGGLLSLAAASVAEMLDLPVLVMTRYTGRLTGDDLLLAARDLGERLIGAVVNAVPQRAMGLFRERVAPVLEARGVPLLGAIPRRRLLGAATIDELAERIDGEYLVGEEHGDQLVETLCIGAMSIDHALTHFRRQRNKVVIAQASRTDVLLAALETETRGLILTGNLEPQAVVLVRAEEQSVPVLRTPAPTLETIEAINIYFGRTRFHQPEKFKLFRQALEEHMDWERLYRAMGWG
ncbi:MAG: phosphotransacetylase family protein, partial [Anaerolineae bacterium]|nr:phosphotransacetylase family protein [Anaerolineae bacterium]